MTKKSYRVPIVNYRTKDVRFRRRPRRRGFTYFGSREVTPQMPLVGYWPGDMARRRQALGEFRGPVSGGWLWSQRTAVAGAIHDALGSLDFMDRERLALAMVRLMPSAPADVYWDTKR